MHLGAVFAGLRSVQALFFKSGRGEGLIGAGERLPKRPAASLRRQRATRRALRRALRQALLRGRGGSHVVAAEVGCIELPDFAGNEPLELVGGIVNRLGESGGFVAGSH